MMCRSRNFFWDIIPLMGISTTARRAHSTSTPSNGATFTIVGALFSNEGTTNVGPGVSLDSRSAPINNMGTINLGANSQLSEETTDKNGVLTTGTYNIGAGATLSFPYLGAITENDAVLSLGGVGASITQLGSLTTNVGTLSIAPGVALPLSGDLTNSGTISIEAGGGLTVPGAFNQTSTGTFLPQVGTYQGVATAGLLTANGTAQLDGTLAVTRTNGFVPMAGQTFPILGYASETGSFAKVTGLTSGSSSIFQLNVGVTGASLTGLAAGSATADLAVSSVTAPAGPVEVGKPITIGYTVKNVGTLRAANSWTDLDLPLEDRQRLAGCHPPRSGHAFGGSRAGIELYRDSHGELAGGSRDLSGRRPH